MVCDQFGKDGCFIARQSWQNNHIICRSTLQAEISLWLTVCISAFAAAKIGIGPSHPEGHCQYISCFPTLAKRFFFLLTTLRFDSYVISGICDIIPVFIKRIEMSGNVMPLNETYGDYI